MEKYIPNNLSTYSRTYLYNKILTPLFTYLYDASNFETLLKNHSSLFGKDEIYQDILKHEKEYSSTGNINSFYEARNSQARDIINNVFLNLPRNNIITIDDIYNKVKE